MQTEKLLKKHSIINTSTTKTFILLGAVRLAMAANTAHTAIASGTETCGTASTATRVDVISGENVVTRTAVDIQRLSTIP